MDASLCLGCRDENKVLAKDARVAIDGCVRIETVCCAGLAASRVSGRAWCI